LAQSVVATSVDVRIHWVIRQVGWRRVTHNASFFIGSMNDVSRIT
jgi:hypothetical protein